MDGDQTSYIMKRIDQHTKNLDNHRIVYRNLLIISICLLVVSIAFLYAIFGVTPSTDRTTTFENLTFIDTGIIGGSVIILIIILYYRFNKEDGQHIQGINKAIQDMGDDIKKANKLAATEKDKADRIKKAAQDLNSNMKKYKQSEAELNQYIRDDDNKTTFSWFK